MCVCVCVCVCVCAGEYMRVYMKIVIDGQKEKRQKREINRYKLCFLISEYNKLRNEYTNVGMINVLKID